MDIKLNLEQYEQVEKVILYNMHDELIKLDKRIEKQKRAINKLISLDDKIDAGRSLNILRKQSYILRSTLLNREDMIRSSIKKCKEKL